jgi:hypothetical protein
MENVCSEAAYASKLLPFEYSEDETLAFEFSHFKLRFFYEYNGVAAHREAVVTSYITTSPLKFTVASHDWIVGESVVFSGFDPATNLNGTIHKITAIVGNTITLDGIGRSPTVTTSNETMAVVYELVTPYHRDDVKNLRIVQELNTCYLFCYKSNGSGDYRIQELRRRDTFNWQLTEVMLEDGPWLDVNFNTTKLMVTGTGSWVPTMTAANLPTGAAIASTEVVGHEAWRAFDDDVDTYWEANNSQEGWLQYAFDTGYTNVLPVFTGYTSGAMTLIVSSDSVGSEVWRIADANTNTDWISSGVLPQSIVLDLGAANIVREYQIRASKLREEFAPRDFILQGSNTGSGGPWTTVDTRTGIAWDSGQKRHFTVLTPTSFRWYHLQVTAVNRVKTTVKHPAVGVKGKKGYIPAYTTTSSTANKAGFATLNMSYAGGKPRIVDGYTIYLGRYNKGEDIINHAPRVWYFEGWDGSFWNLLDAQQNYTTWNEYRSQFIPIQNEEPYLKYRIRIKSVFKAGDVNPRIGKLMLSSPDAPGINLRASSKLKINDNQGFLPTDVGRLIRLKGSDGTWRPVRITAVSTAVDVTTVWSDAANSDPLPNAKAITFWRLGLWSDTTGWPICGTLHQNRLFAGGGNGYPDHIVGSVVGRHTLFRQVSPQDVVTDAQAIVTRCNSKVMSRIVWVRSTGDGLRIGTGAAEHVLSAPAEGGLGPRNFQIFETTKRGALNHEAVSVDDDVVFVQKNGRALYAHTYKASSDDPTKAYKAPLMSKLGAHLLYPRVMQLVYQQEPHSVIWGRREDGSVVAMTYSNDDDIFGGHRHDFSGVVKDICVVTSPTDRQDSLWMVIKRTINGVDVHYIERMYRFWDFGDVLTADATYVDSALRYLGTTPISVVYGLQHLEGQYVTVLADKVVYKHRGPVTNGKITLDVAATYVVVGLPMVMEGEIITPRTGAEGSMAEPLMKRPHKVTLKLWQSEGGEVGRWDEDHGVVEWTPIEYNVPLTASVPELTLKTCMSRDIVPPGGYGTLGTIRFRQTDPIPLHIVGVYPQSYVEDEP